MLSFCAGKVRYIKQIQALRQIFNKLEKMKIAIYCGGEIQLTNMHFDYYVGVDRGCLAVLAAQHPLHLAVGDFDSVTSAQLQQIKQAAQTLILAPSEKDDSDSELALKAVFARYPLAEVTLFGALGGRFDHSLINLFLPSNPDLAPFMRQITLRDEQNMVCFYPAGDHWIEQDPTMRYIAFLAEGGRLAVTQAKYELTPANYFPRKIYASNEFLDKPIRLEVDSGYAVVIQSQD